MNRSVSAQPYGSNYFLPGKVAGKAATFLLDTGCTKNLLCRRRFDTFSTRDQVNLEPYEGEHGTLAEGSCIPCCGVIELTGRVYDQVISETFIVNAISEATQVPHRFQQVSDMMPGRELLVWTGLADP